VLAGGDEQQIGEGVGRKQQGTHFVRGKLQEKTREEGNAERANSRMASDVGSPGIESGGGGMESD
jgi:hypothetical protein